MKKRNGITMATLVITLIISVILMGVTVYGVFNWTKKAGDSKIYSALSFVYRRLSDLEGIKEECRDGHLVLKESISDINSKYQSKFGSGFKLFKDIPNISSAGFPDGATIPSNYDIYELEGDSLEKIGISQALIPRGMRIFYLKSQQTNFKDKILTNKGIMKKDNSGNTVITIDYSDIAKIFENTDKTVLNN